MRIFLRYWFPLFLYCGLIFVVSSMAGQELNVPVRLSDKLIHFGEFAVLGLLVTRTLTGGISKFFTPKEIFLVTVLFATSWGAFDELLQSWTPGRSVEFADLAADVAGATFASLFYLGIRSKIRRRGCWGCWTF